MTKNQHKGKKTQHELEDLKAMREEEKLHGQEDDSLAMRGENDNESLVNPFFRQAESNTCDMVREGREYTSLMVDSIHSMQDTMGLVFAAQRRMAEIWMESWFGIFMPRLFTFTGQEVAPPAENQAEREARTASALVMGG